MLLAEVAATSAAVAATSARSRKVALLAACLRGAAPDEVPVVVAYLSGELRQRRTGLGYAALRTEARTAPEPSLDVLEVDAEFERLSSLAGKGSQAQRRDGFAALLARATEPEQRLLRGLVSGELRQGALEGVMLEAVAAAAEVPSAAVRRAVTLAGSVAPWRRQCSSGARPALTHSACTWARHCARCSRSRPPTSPTRCRG